MGFAQGFSPPSAPPASRMTMALTSVNAGGFLQSPTVTVPNPTFTLTVTP